jgi:hypothetical protein
VFGHVAACETVIIHQTKTLLREFTKYFDVHRPLAKHGVGNRAFRSTVII